MKATKSYQKWRKKNWMYVSNEVYAIQIWKAAWKRGVKEAKRTNIPDTLREEGELLADQCNAYITKLIEHHHDCGGTMQTRDYIDLAGVRIRLGFSELLRTIPPAEHRGS